MDPSDVVQVNLLQARENLAAQEARLLADLAQIRKGIESIDTTIQVVRQTLGMSNHTGSMATVEPMSSHSLNGAVSPTALSPTVESVAPSPAPKAKRQKPGPKPKIQTSVPEPAIAQEQTSTTKTPKSSTKTAKTATTKTSTPKSARGTRGRKRSEPKATSSKTTSKRKTANTDMGWQHYMLADYRTQPLTEVVHSIFEASPDAVMGSSDLISHIFSPEIPKEARTTARDRLLNILSIGVNDNKLERVKSGKYRLVQPS
ncbi:MAG: hypothetical protein EA367_13400 [Leptolyngbya sp. DLM2.Bin15]|nr:MAG: hypothetical protein EA367_13400 [Leptolyngbya sp. DLM2.Bin15]